MPLHFRVVTTTSFERESRKLARQHTDIVGFFQKVIIILSADPYNLTRMYPIKKLEAVAHSEGQYRIRMRRFRFRYDIEGRIVYLKACSLRREDTY